ncbi:MAG: DNA translocase FtsK, partial [Gammaproteobacteria bacterium]|nr:DNA translocase FtsK [Gammaproteobacteria bacterium]
EKGSALLAGALPTIQLLDSPKERVANLSPETLKHNSFTIEEKLRHYHVIAKVVATHPGPVVTRYEIEPDEGVKGNSIVNLAKDLARILKVVSIRVVETIPGKNYMALELPNPKRDMILLKEIIDSENYRHASSPLAMALGKDIVGNPVVADLAKMPHLLVAGTTGSGKSVGLSSMILSILFKASPQQVRFLMIDPKMLELSVYEGIGHLITPVITDMSKAALALRWCVAEMERRYKLMAHIGVRHITSYNDKVGEADGDLQPIKDPFKEGNGEVEVYLQQLPYIVVIIDELADLMMQEGKKIEQLIARLAQKARAAGIHLILATQRPSVDVITGLIKANIPTRIAFQVSSKIDSRTIIDQMGAEALLGMGDMLYLPSGTGVPTRVHGAFVSEQEVHRVVAYLRTQGEPEFLVSLDEFSSSENEVKPNSPLNPMTHTSDNSLYAQALTVLQGYKGRPSASILQRSLNIGYNRAASLMDELERNKVVSPMNTNGQRELLTPDKDKT